MELKKQHKGIGFTLIVSLLAGGISGLFFGTEPINGEVPLCSSLSKTYSFL
jgi:LDH2 family malate/lactate/ureidoglycolate dehydrogenase